MRSNGVSRAIRGVCCLREGVDFVVGTSKTIGRVKDVRPAAPTKEVVLVETWGRVREGRTGGADSTKAGVIGEMIGERKGGS